MGTHTVRHPVPESSTEGAKRSAGSECLIVEYSHVDSPCSLGVWVGCLREREREAACVCQHSHLLQLRLAFGPSSCALVQRGSSVSE